MAKVVRRSTPSDKNNLNRIEQDLDYITQRLSLMVKDEVSDLQEQYDGFSQTEQELRAMIQELKEAQTLDEEREEVLSSTIRELKESMAEVMSASKDAERYRSVLCDEVQDFEVRFQSMHNASLDMLKAHSNALVDMGEEIQTIKVGATFSDRKIEDMRKDMEPIFERMVRMETESKKNLQKIQATERWIKSVEREEHRQYTLLGVCAGITMGLAVVAVALWLSTIL